MLRSMKELFGYAIHAKDGEIGKVTDFYFDDSNWATRYIVVDTGKWLTGRQVLLSPRSFESPDWRRQSFSTALARSQIEHSPGIDSNRPVTRRHEIALSEYYNWPPYWMASNANLAAYGMTGIHLQPEIDTKKSRTAVAEQESHLQSARDVLGYHIQAKDGELGHIEDFILNDRDWQIRHIVADTGNWLPGRKVLIQPQWIREVRWSEPYVNVNLSREQIRRSPEYDPDEPVNEEYEKLLFDYYGRPKGMALSRKREE